MVGRMPAHPLHFVVIDDNADTRFIVARSLSKTFPGATIEECADAQRGLEACNAPGVSTAVIHRTTEMTGLYFIQLLRKTNPTVPILMVSGIDRTPAALAAGANQFVPFDQWQRIGLTIAEMIAVQPAAAPVATEVQ